MVADLVGPTPKGEAPANTPGMHSVEGQLKVSWEAVRTTRSSASSWQA